MSSIHITFTHMNQSDSVTEHVNELMSDLIRITDNKYPFHVNLSKEDEVHFVVINCNYNNKPLTSKASHINLYKALSKSVDSMKKQVQRKADRLRKV